MRIHDLLFWIVIAGFSIAFTAYLTTNNDVKMACLAGMSVLLVVSLGAFFAAALKGFKDEL
jgi:CHASE2 domain-containing sensor protein